MSKIPSVTKVLSPWSDFSMIPPDVLAMASERGSMVHRACGAMAKGVWAPQVPQEYAGYVESFSIWFRQAVVEALLVEPELVHPVYGYCGHPDLIVRIKGDNAYSLLDLKTPAVAYKSWRVQLAAYRELANANDCPIGRVFSVRLKKDGKLPIVNEFTGSTSGDFSIFLSCLQAWKFFRGEGS